MLRKAGWHEQEHEKFESRGNEEYCETHVIIFGQNIYIFVIITFALQLN